ncbi:hypothetical protein [Hamadaea tsunoensis]|uniref:hypothetical protein n=1 Tax=Hamadaea tsunoensis TaxID=53368 RepID=UPI0012FA8036|nr:hypothetical protein [Hamadaea tsunoensis]
MPVNPRAAQLQEATCEAITTAVRRYLPAGAYRDFTLWAFSPANPRRQDYLQVTGLTQLVTMNVTLLSGLVEHDDWADVERYLALMNAYQFFETISDNVAMGLGSPRLAETGRERLELVTALNRAMIGALAPGRATPALLLLSGAPRAAAERVSAFDQSLASAKYAGIAEEYARHGAGITSGEIEFGLWGALVTNVETCRDIAEAMASRPVGPLLRDGLSSRYRAVDRSLRAASLSRMELATLGAHSILVMPTLAYGIGVLADATTGTDLAGVLADGTLTDVLFDAALLVRLQNDVGTRLLRMATAQQDALLHRLARQAADTGRTTVADAFALLVEAAVTEVSLTRLEKDIVNDEFNIALWNARRAGDAAGALRALGESLAYFAVLYTQHSGRLASGLGWLDERLGDRRISTVVERFVRFHERMYAHRYTEAIGEYAI